MSKKHPTLQVTRTERRSAGLGVGASGLFLVVFGALHVLRPDLDPTWFFASEYALGWSWPLMAVASLSLAAASIAALLALRRHARGAVSRIGLVVIGVSTVGVLIAAIFRSDPVTTLPDQVTFSGMMHGIGGQLKVTPYAMLLVTTDRALTALFSVAPTGVDPVTSRFSVDATALVSLLVRRISPEVRGFGGML